MYNPFSLFKSFNNGDVSSYWFENGTTRALIDMLSQMPPIDMAEVEGTPCMAEDFNVEFDSYQYPLPMLYHSNNQDCIKLQHVLVQPLADTTLLLFLCSHI